MRRKEEERKDELLSCNNAHDMEIPGRSQGRPHRSLSGPEAALDGPSFSIITFRRKGHSVLESKCNEEER